jgi:hypothetical protein
VPELVDVVVVDAAVVAKRESAGDTADVRMRREDAAVDDRDPDAPTGELAQVHHSPMRVQSPVRLPQSAMETA